MRVLLSALFVGAAVCACVLPASPQEAASLPFAWPGSIVLPLPGVPVSFDESEISQSGVEVHRKVYRDGSGRLRIDPFGDPSLRMVQLIDPNAGVLAILGTQSRIAHTLSFPRIVSPAKPGFFSLGPAVGHSTAAEEKLGKREREG